MCEHPDTVAKLKHQIRAGQEIGIAAADLDENGRLLSGQFEIGQGSTDHGRAGSKHAQIVEVPTILGHEAMRRHAEEFASQAKVEQADAEKQIAIQDSERNLRDVERQLELAGNVVSPYGGEILEVKVSSGATVALGDPVLSIQPDVPDLQTLLYLPAAQAKDLAEACTNLKKSSDSYTADLAEASAKDLLTFRRPAGAGQDNAPQMTVKDAKGTLKIWVQDSAMTKLQIHLTGIRTFNDQDQPVDQTLTTQIKEVGTTKIAVPEEAKKKLEAAK